jgi:hypothetical protein
MTCGIIALIVGFAAGYGVREWIPRRRHQAAENLPSFLFKDDVCSVLKGGVKDRQLVNEVLGSFAKFALNLCRKSATPIQRGFHSGLLERI